MDIFHNLSLGFEVALSLNNLWYCFLGMFVGTTVGVLPGKVCFGMARQSGHGLIR